jgi:hypothetical protein
MMIINFLFIYFLSLHLIFLPWPLILPIFPKDFR